MLAKGATDHRLSFTVVRADIVRYICFQDHDNLECHHEMQPIWYQILHYFRFFDKSSSSSSSSNSFYLQQNTTMEQYQEKENTL